MNIPLFSLVTKTSLSLKIPSLTMRTLISMEKFPLVTSQGQREVVTLFSYPPSYQRQTKVVNASSTSLCPRSSINHRSIGSDPLPLVSTNPAVGRGRKVYFPMEGNREKTIVKRMELLRQMKHLPILNPRNRFQNFKRIN